MSEQERKIETSDSEVGVDAVVIPPTLKVYKKMVGEPINTEVEFDRNEFIKLFTETFNESEILLKDLTEMWLNNKKEKPDYLFIGDNCGFRIAEAV